jgi:multiple sugar transport system permease protein
MNEMSKQSFFYKLANNKRYLSYLFICPTIILLFSIAIFPLFYSLGSSLTDFTFGRPKINFIGLNNFLKIFKDKFFLNGLKLTIVFVAGSTFLSFTLGFFIALLLDQKLIGKGVFRTIFLSPMCIPTVVVGIVWLLLFMPDFSFLSYLLQLIGIHPPDWLLKPGWALFSIMIAYVWQWTPFFILMLSAGIAALPTETYEAALVDGATWIQRVRFITIPLLKPIILLTILIRMMDAFRIFDHVFVMTEGGPGRSTQVLSFYIYLSGIRYRYIGYASAMSWIMLIIIIVLSMFMIRLFRQIRM